MRSKLLSLLSDSFVYGISSLVGQIASFLLLPLYTSYLTPGDYGVLAMLNIVTMSFAPLATMGLTSAAFRRLNLQHDDAGRAIVLTTTAVGVTSLSCICLIVCVIFAKYPTKWIVADEAMIGLVRLTLLSAAIMTIGDLGRIQLRARRQAKTIGAINFASILVSVAVTTYGIIFLRLGISGVVIGNLAGSAVGTVAAISLTYRSFLSSVRLDELRKLLSYGIPLVPHRFISLGLMMYSQFYVREAMGLAEAGLFDMAAKFAMPLGLVINAIQEAWIPFKFQIHASDDKAADFFRQTFTLYIALMGFLWVESSAWGPDALRLMTHESFGAAALLVPFMALSRVMSGIYYMAGTGIELSDDTRAFSFISGVGLIVLVATTWLIVPKFGAPGAAICNSLSTLSMVIMARRMARRSYFVQYDWSRIALLTATAGTCGIACCMVQGEALYLRLVTAACASLVYAAAALLLVRRWSEFPSSGTNMDPVVRSQATVTAAKS